MKIAGRTVIERFSSNKRVVKALSGAASLEIQDKRKWHETCLVKGMVLGDGVPRAFPLTQIPEALPPCHCVDHFLNAPRQ
jgi:hypothetical protein